MSDCLPFSLFFLFCFTDPRCFCRAVIHSFIYSFIHSIDSYILFCVYTHFVHSFFLAHTAYTFIYILPARCHSLSSLYCNCLSFSPMSFQPALPPPTYSSHSTATQMAPLTPLPLAVQAPPRSPMALQEATAPTPTPKPSPPPSTTPTSSPAKSSTSPSCKNTSSTWTTAKNATPYTQTPSASTSGSARTSTAARNKSTAKTPSV